jgi:hypothetical protein
MIEHIIPCSPDRHLTFCDLKQGAVLSTPISSLGLNPAQRLFNLPWNAEIGVGALDMFTVYPLRH